VYAATHPQSILSLWLLSLFPTVRCSVAACLPCKTALLQPHTTHLVPRVLRQLLPTVFLAITTARRRVGCRHTTAAAAAAAAEVCAKTGMVLMSPGCKHAQGESQQQAQATGCRARPAQTAACVTAVVVKPQLCSVEPRGCLICQLCPPTTGPGPTHFFGPGRNVS
jgi:hypothetical protein